MKELEEMEVGGGDGSGGRAIFRFHSPMEFKIKCIKRKKAFKKKKKAK